MERICALIEFTPRGHMEYMQPKEKATGWMTLEGYEKPESWHPNQETIYPDGIPILDKRPPLDDSISVLLRAPNLRLCDPFEDDAVINSLIERFSSDNWNLRKCALPGHLEYWTANGARLGHIVQGRITWDVAA